jgi:type II secretory pathway pseudopilin PulG
MKINSTKGFTIVESLIVMIILLAAFIGGLSIFNTIDKGQLGNESSLNFTIIRNQLVSLIIDDTSWAKIIGAPGNVDNPKFSCILNQNSLVASDRDCFGKTDPFVIRDITGALYNMNGIDVFDFRSTTQGFSNKGRACSTFNSTPGSGDPRCPFLMTVTWKALCTASPCVNPPILFEGRAAVNGGAGQAPLNTGNLSFQIIKSNLYCPPANAVGGHLASGSNVSVATADKVKSLIVADAPTTEYGNSDVILAPCRKTIVSFTEDIDPIFTVNANNTSSVSILDETTGSSVFEFRRSATAGNYDYKLLYNGGVVVNAKPSWVTLTRTSQFKFEITNGLVRFCMDDRCTFYFPQKLDFPFRVAFRPASSLFTPEGFNMITYTSFDL